LPAGNCGDALHTLTTEHAQGLSERLHAHRLQLFLPAATKTLRKFTSGEDVRADLDEGVKSGRRDLPWRRGDKRQALQQ